MDRKQAGRLGGRETFKRYGLAHMSRIGQKGGRAFASKYAAVFAGRPGWSGSLLRSVSVGADLPKREESEWLR